MSIYVDFWRLGPSLAVFDSCSVFDSYSDAFTDVNELSYGITALEFHKSRLSSQFSFRPSLSIGGYTELCVLSFFLDEI